MTVRVVSCCQFYLWPLLFAQLEHPLSTPFLSFPLIEPETQLEISVQDLARTPPMSHSWFSAGKVGKLTVFLCRCTGYTICISNVSPIHNLMVFNYRTIVDNCSLAVFGDSYFKLQ